MTHTIRLNVNGKEHTVEVSSRRLLGVAAPTLMKEFDISPATMGYVLSGWNWAYTACQLIIGPVVDRFGSWIVLGVGASVWSLSTIALPLASTALGLFLFRAVFGVGHSMLIPAQGSTISKWFRSEQRSTALGFAFSGSQVGSAIGAAAHSYTPYTLTPLNTPHTHNTPLTHTPPLTPHIPYTTGHTYSVGVYSVWCEWSVYGFVWCMCMSGLCI